MDCACLLRNPESNDGDRVFAHQAKEKVFERSLSDTLFLRCQFREAAATLRTRRSWRLPRRGPPGCGRSLKYVRAESRLAIRQHGEPMELPTTRLPGYGF